MRSRRHNGATNTHRKSKSGLVLFYYFKFGLAANQTYLMFVSCFFQLYRDRNNIDTPDKSICFGSGGCSKENLLK